jgi:hypothetical protein
VIERHDVQRYERRRQALRNDFTSYKNHYQELADHFRPRRGFFLSQTNNDQPITGKKVHDKIINTSPLRSSKNAQSGLQAGVTSPSRPWKRLGPENPEMNEIDGVREFHSELDRRMDLVLAKSNFYQATHTAYADFVDFGPGCIQIDEHAEETIRCTVHPIGSWVAAKNADGHVDVFYRDYKVTGHELVDRFGEDALEPSLVTQIEKEPYKRHNLYNAIEPNPFFEEGRPAIGVASFKYISVWWIGGRTKTFVREHGYHEFPVMVFRFYNADTGDVMGSSPGMDALGDAKQLQHQERTKLEAIDKMVKPPLQAPSSLRTAGVLAVPGKVNYHDSQQKIEPLWNLNLPLQYVLEDIRNIETRISQAYFEDLFLMITNNVAREITAREVEERHEEKLIMLGPVLESISDDFLDPAIDRILAIMQRQGKWPEAPPDLLGEGFKVEYTSILAQAQRAVQTVAIEQGLNFVGAAAPLIPEILDRIDADGMADAYFERIGFPPDAVRSVRDATALRAQRAAQQRANQMLEMAGQAASAAKDASASGLEDANVLSTMMGQAA